MVQREEEEEVEGGERGAPVCVCVCMFTQKSRRTNIDSSLGTFSCPPPIGFRKLNSFIPPFFSQSFVGVLTDR